MTDDQLAGTEYRLCRRLKILSNDSRMASRDFEQRKRWTVGLPATLLPIA
jgi:hypothetical protein